MKSIVLALSLLLMAQLAVAADHLPAGENEAKERVDKSPRHKEYVDIAVPGASAPLKSYVVYPEKKDKAGVIIVIHEIFGLSDWIKGVADQLAADGFIAIAPDMLSEMGGTDSFKSRDEVTGKIRGLKPDQVVKYLNAVRDYGAKQPASNGKTATIGFCWGGARSFEFAAAQPGLNAAVVYYGTSPSEKSAYDKVKAPVLGLYGADDARVNATIDPAKEAMKAGGKWYMPHIYDGAGHGFLRQQDGRSGANMKASEQAWPETVKFLKEHLK